MKAELQKKLVEKYPKFFQYLDENETPMIDPSEPIMDNVQKLYNQEKIVLPMQFGFECGDGWYMLLDELMGEIKNHLENVNRNNKNKFKYQWMWKLQAYLRRKYFKKKKIEAFAEWIYEKAPRKNIPEVTVQIDQIKEKFGGLRFYYSGGDDAIHGMTSLAESLSYRICERCGTTNSVGQTEGWVYTICETCKENDSRAKDMNYRKRKEK